MKKHLAIAMAAAILTPLAAVAQEDREEAAEERREYLEERKEIDTMAEEGLEQLFTESPEARALYDDAYGYAIFGVLKFALGVTGGGGGGVAVAKDSGERIYMNMGTGGIGFEIGGARYHVLFLFEDEEAFNKFVYDGRSGEVSAEAVAGQEAVSAESSFKEGVAVFQFNQRGLMAGADISGSKFWIDRELSPDYVAKQKELEVERERETHAERVERARGLQR